MKILITGGAGFLGKWLIRELPGEHEIIIVDSLDPQVHHPSTPGSPRGFAPALKSHATCIAADVRDCDAYAEAARDCDIVIHLAAQTGTGQSMYERSRYVAHNVDGTAKLLDFVASWAHPPRLLMLASSRAVYGEGAYKMSAESAEIHYPQGRCLDDLQSGKWEPQAAGRVLQPLPMHESHQPCPTSVYGLTKLWQEQLFRNFAAASATQVAILRFQNVFGPGQDLKNPYTGIVGIFADAIAHEREVELFEDGLMTRDFVFAEDVAKTMSRIVLCPHLLEASEDGILNVGSGQGTSLTDLVAMIARLLHRPLQARTSGRFRAGDVRHAVADVSKLARVLGGWRPTPLEDGLRQYLAWYESEASTRNGCGLTQSLDEMAAHGMLLKSRAGENASA